MLRQAQHERIIRNDFSPSLVRPEPVEGRLRVFSLHLKKETYSAAATSSVTCSYSPTPEAVAEPRPCLRHPATRTHPLRPCARRPRAPLCPWATVRLRGGACNAHTSREELPSAPTPERTRPAHLMPRAASRSPALRGSWPG